MRGEVFVASTEHGTTKRIASTPEQERNVSWSPDGKTLYYAGERDGSWNIYAATLARPDEERFFRATLLDEKAALATADDEFQPLLSPDGKSLAYLRNRDEIALFDPASGQSRTLVPAARNYSYEDNDLRFAWSPDSQWLVTTVLQEGRWISDVAVVNAATGELTDMTVSGYEEWAPQWSADGTALLFASNRFGRRDHGSWDPEGDLLALDLTQEAHDRSHMSHEEYARWKKKAKKAKGKKVGDLAAPGAARAADVDRRILGRSRAAHGEVRHGWQAGADSPETVGRVIAAIKDAAVKADRSIDEDHYGAAFGFRFGAADDPGIAQVMAQYEARTGRSASLYFAVGNADAIVERIARYIEHDACKFILRPVADGDEDMYAQTKRLVEEVLPRIAERWPRPARSQR